MGSTNVSPTGHHRQLTSSGGSHKNWTLDIKPEYHTCAKVALLLILAPHGWGGTALRWRPPQSGGGCEEMVLARNGGESLVLKRKKKNGAHQLKKGRGRAVDCAFQCPISFFFFKKDLF